LEILTRERGRVGGKRHCQRRSAQKGWIGSEQRNNRAQFSGGVTANKGGKEERHLHEKTRKAGSAKSMKAETTAEMEWKGPSFASN